MAKRRRLRRSSTIRKQIKRNTRRLARPKTKGLRFSQYKPYTTQNEVLEPTFKTVGHIGQKGQEKQKQEKNKYNTLSFGVIRDKVSKDLICKRRSQRKEIIHALNKSGKSGQKKPNNQFRKVKC